MKKNYPGGVKLTLKTARAVAVQEFGTAKGLEKEEVAMPGYTDAELVAAVVSGTGKTPSPPERCNTSTYSLSARRSISQRPGRGARRCRRALTRW